MNSLNVTGKVVSIGENPKNKKIIGMIIDDQLYESSFQASFIGPDAETIRSKISPGDCVSVSANVAGILTNPKGNLITLFNPKLLTATRHTHVASNLLEDNE